MVNIHVMDEAHWHRLRLAHIGGSEVSALFGMSPWLSRWQLHMAKCGKLPLPDISENAVVQFGKYAEPAFAEWAQSKFGVSLRKVHRYCTADDTPGLGASLDFEETGSGDGLVPWEFKASMYGDGWDWDGDVITECPDNYILQTQHQMAATGAKRAVICAFVGGDLRRMIVPRRENMIAAIKREVAQFWTDLRAGKEPPVDFTADAEAIGRLAAQSPLCRVDLPAEAEALAQAYLAAKAAENEAATAATAARAEITKMLLDLAAAKGAVVDEQKVVADLGPYRVSATAVAGNPGTVVTEEMIGQVIGTRAGYRRITISEPKPKKSSRKDAA